MHLHRLPNELIQNIAFLVVAHDPLGPPAPLIPLLIASKRIHAALSSPSSALKARIFRLKFDTSSIARRFFFPYDVHLADQLDSYCHVLRVVKSNNVKHEDVANILFSAYIMMLDNDGKNFAQLEWAGIAHFADKFIRLRLWENRMQPGNAGWPVASDENRCALWVAWLTMDKANLFKEPARAQDDFVTLIFPFILLSPRYPSTEAPPNHFHLPLLPESPTYQRPLVSSSNPALPPYPHYAPHPTILQPYFGSIQAISLPLISIAAKLLYTVRKEIFPINIPHILPPGLHPDNYAEFNKVKAAEVPRGARWDWNRGCAVAVNSKMVRDSFKPSTIEEFKEFDELVANTVEVISDGDEESRRWDQEWWRRILCADLKSRRPKFPPGLVYKPGCLRGTWQGRLYMPLAEALHAALDTYPYYPGYPTNEETQGDVFPTFSETSTSLVMQPVFLNLEEHHDICHCPSYHLRDPDKVRDVHHKGCGTIPVPLPSVYPPRYMRWRGVRPHMIVVPPDEDDGQVEAGGPPEPAQNEGEAQQSAAEEPAAPTTDTQEPLVFGIPSSEHWEIEENPVAPAVNAALTAGGQNTNTNTNTYVYATVAPALPFPANTNLDANTTDTQPEVQTALPAPVGPPQTAGHATGSQTEAGHTTQGQTTPAQPPVGDASATQQTPPDLLTYLTEQLDLRRQTDPRTPRLVSTPVDYSMNNAYFPGDVVPSLMFMKRRAEAGPGSSSSGRRRRDEIVFGFRELGMGSFANQVGQQEWKMADGKCATVQGKKGVDSASGENRGEKKDESGQRKLYVYETYDPEKESAHDASVCQTCKEWEDVKRKERKVQDERCERKLEKRVEREEERRRKGDENEAEGDDNAAKMLEEYMQDYGERAGISAGGVSRSHLTDFEPLDSKFEQALSDAVTFAAATAAKSSAASSTRATVSAPISGPASEPSDSDYESDDSSSNELSSCHSYGSEADEGESHSRPQPDCRVRWSRRLSVLGDDLPYGQPPFVDSASQNYVPPTRRVFDRSRIGAPEGCCGGVRDIVITGETPSRHVAWHRQMYRLYGRVRSWDGMIGLLRVDERSMPGYNATGLQHLGGDQEESEYWSVITNMFICGYVVGGRTFVGEWRMAASDPLKPGWSGPILMSLREQEAGEEPVWEPVGGQAI